jgi:uncharacterized membrane protein
MNDWVVSGLVMVGMGALFVALGLPLARGKVRRNRWFGYRTPRTMKDDRIWEPVNAMTGIAFVVAGVLAVAIGGLLVVFSGREELAQLALGIGVPALVLWLVVTIWRGWRLAVTIDRLLASEDAGAVDVDNASARADRPT